MRRLLTGYAVSYNRRHRRHGQLFQNRYKSIICQEDVYLQELVRYIHLNPWDEIKKMRLTGQDRIKSDQRILGESDFVLGVLSESEEKFERKHRLRRLGYDFEKILERPMLKKVIGLKKFLL